MPKEKQFILDVSKIKRDLEKVRGVKVKKSDLAYLSNVTVNTLANWENKAPSVLELISVYEKETGNSINDILIEV